MVAQLPVGLRLTPPPGQDALARCLPLYEGGRKSGKTRQLQFKLKPGEAM